MDDTRENQNPPNSSKSDDPNPLPALATGAVFVFTLPVPTFVVLLTLPEPQPVEWEAKAAALGLTPYELASGASTYARSCAVCHGSDAQGVANLGKPLRNSAFVQNQSDEALFELIVKGRTLADPLNTTGALMPPAGRRA